MLLQVSKCLIKRWVRQLQWVILALMQMQVISSIKKDLISKIWAMDSDFQTKTLSLTNLIISNLIKINSLQIKIWARISQTAWTKTKDFKGIPRTSHNHSSISLRIQIKTNLRLLHQTLANSSITLINHLHTILCSKTTSSTHRTILNPTNLVNQLIQIKDSRTIWVKTQTNLISYHSRLMFHFKLSHRTCHRIMWHPQTINSILGSIILQLKHMPKL